MRYCCAIVMTYSDTTVIIPTLNEVGALPSVIKRVREACPGIQIVVADDGSTDGTREFVLNLASRNLTKSGSLSLIDRSANPCKGLTASVVDGIKSIATPFFVVMDGDLQHPPEILPKLIAQVRDSKDLAIGIRGDLSGSFAFYRALISSIANMLARTCLRFSGSLTSDPMSGLFAGSARVKSIVASQSQSFEMQGYKILFDILRTAPMKLKIFEVPFTFGARPSGVSKLSSSHALCFIRSVVKTASCRLRENYSAVAVGYTARLRSHKRL